MANAAVLYDNLADAGTVTASSWIAAAPPSMLQNQHVARRWKGRSGDTEYILADLGSLQSIDTVALFGIQGIVAGVQENLTAAAVTRVRISSVDATGEAGDLYDSTSAAGNIKAAYGALVRLLPTPVSGRYVRVDISEGGVTAILAGRLVIGLRSAFTINFDYGWSYGYVDLSRLRKSAGGQTFIDRDDRLRTLNLNFGFLDEADRYGFVHEVDRLNGISRDVLFVIDTASSDIGRDTIWGLLKDTSPVTQPAFNLFAKSYAIEERR